MWFLKISHMKKAAEWSGPCVPAHPHLHNVVFSFEGYAGISEYIQ